MVTALLLLRQIAVLFTYIAIGYLKFRSKLISNEGFIGIPLVEATMGANSVIYLASMVG